MKERKHESKLNNFKVTKIYSANIIYVLQSEHDVISFYG